MHRGNVCFSIRQIEESIRVGLLRLTSQNVTEKIVEKYDSKFKSDMQTNSHICVIRHEKQTI